MGEPAQKRLIRKLDLERFLSKIKPYAAPKVRLEQYTIPESVAASMLYLAAYSYGDIQSRRVLDLGCGTGRLGLGAVFMGAEAVVGIDIDTAAVKAATINSASLSFKESTDWIAGDIEAITGKFDTVVQNPPFGVQKRAADRRFLQKALEVGYNVYSLHNHPTFDKVLMGKLGSGQLMQVEPTPFLARFIKEHGGRVEAVYALPFTIPHMFDFHTKKQQEIIVDLYVVRKD